MLYQYLIMCKYLYNAYATERLCHTGTLWYDVQIHSNVTCRLSLPVMTYVMICKYLDVTRTCRLCHTRYLLIRKYIFYYVQLLVQYMLRADDNWILCYVQIMPHLMMYVQLLHAYYNSLCIVFPSCRLCWSAGSLTPTSGQPSSSWPTCSRISTSPHSPSTWSRTVSQSWLNLQRCTYTREEKTMVWGGSILIRFR